MYLKIRDFQRLDMNDWKKYSKNRVYKEHKDGFLIFKPEANMKIVPLECPLCNFILGDQDDILYFNIFSVCSHCGIKFAEGNKNKWLKEGWRPNEEEVEKERVRRKSLPIRIRLV